MFRPVRSFASPRPMLPGLPHQEANGSYRRPHTGASWWHASQLTVCVQTDFSKHVCQEWAESLKRSMASARAFVHATSLSVVDFIEALA